VTRPEPGPYDRFLRSADVASWRDCMEEAVRVLDQLPEGDEQVEALAEALCITMYLEWLGRVSGDLPGEEAARRRYRELQALLRRRSVAGSAPALPVCWGLELAWSGFRVQASALLDRGRDTPPEHLVLVLPEDAVRSLATLRPLFAGPTPCRFLPAVHAYGSALANLGAVHEARALVTDPSWSGTEPLLLDILASTSERLGNWTEAHDAYRRSPWPAHRLRAAMVGAIAGRDDQLELDEPIRRLVGQFDGELDQDEVTRSMAFLNACIWQPVDDWVVELELGKLNFGRRRYAEADLHLQRALARAPEDARFVIARLRFFNLTWLSGGEPESGLQLVPEALSAGQDALDRSGEDDETAEIRIWMAHETGDLSLLPASLDGWDPYSRGDAHDTLGDSAAAVDGWIESFGTFYNHRAAWRLITKLGEAGLVRTAAHLADVVMRESRDDFLALWETAQGLDRLVADSQDDDTGDGPDQPIDRYHRRLVELSQFEFKNAVRSHELVVRAGHQDLAEELLLRAARQAESVSELLAVAVLRRRVRSSRALQVDQEGLWCLARALGEARDRLERLQIARELFHYGRIRDARGILVDERVLAHDTALSHIEMTAVLQCGPWLTTEERDRLVARAKHRLLLDHRSGALGAHVETYRNRLVETLAAFDRPLADRVADELADPTPDAATDAGRPGPTDGTWPSIRDRLDQALDDDAGETPVALDAFLGTADPAGSFGLRLALCGHLRGRLVDLLDTLRGVAASVPADETPVSKADDRGDGPRTIELCDLWRAHIMRPDGNGGQTTQARLSAFLDTEQTLLERWERSRREASMPTLRQIARVADALAASLGTLVGTAERDQVHPVLSAIFEHVRLDAASLVEQAAEEARLARRELALAADPAGPP
jgi:transcriptional regulator with XRE-family HTH domain/tetratricopeptide (TPR) repeat protein